MLELDQIGDDSMTGQQLGEPQRLAPLAVDADGFADLLMCSKRHIRRLDAEALIPRGFHLGGRCKRWRVDEIREWLAAGSPDRARWERRRRP